MFLAYMNEKYLKMMIFTGLFSLICLTIGLAVSYVWQPYTIFNSTSGEIQERGEEGYFQEITIITPVWDTKNELMRYGDKCYSPQFRGAVSCPPL